MGEPIDRRTFLRLGRDLALLGLAPTEVMAAALAAAGARGAGVFLSAPRMRTLRALCAHYVPGPPEDPDPGALEAGAPEYIDLLLGAFSLPLPPILAGGPFSNRSAGGRNFFAEFLELDALEERIWRTRIEGSRGLPEREWNGPVVGLQERYTRGLHALDDRSRLIFRAPFHALSRWKRDVQLWTATGELAEFLDLAFQHTVEGTYGPPEYGGNRDLVGWRNIGWPGDIQPRVFSEEEIREPDADQAEAVARARANARAFRGTGDA